MKRSRLGLSFELPPRKSNQTLQGFVLEHLQEFERGLSCGVQYASLVQALHAAGFSEGTVMSLRKAVSKARMRARACKKTQPLQAPAPLITQAAQPVQQSSLAPAKDDRAAISRRLRDLARPPRSGEPDPLDS